MNSEPVSPTVRILIAEPDKILRGLLAKALKKEGFEVILAVDGEDASRLAATRLPHVLLSEVMLPGIDGIELCHQLRKDQLTSGMIIIFCTIRSEDYSQVAAFAAGADDYIVKPVKPNLLLLRMRALLRRAFTAGKHDQPDPNVLKIDRERYLVVLHGAELSMPRKEFELLALLCSVPGKVFTRQEISRLIWGHELDAHNRTIDVHVSKLREKLGGRYIKTVKGIGYSLEM